MESARTVSDLEIIKALVKTGFTQCVDEGRLMLTELLVKANAGYYNSHTEEAFMRSFGLIKTDRTLNKKGRQFICSMLYMHSNKQPEAYELMKKYRKA